MPIVRSDTKPTDYVPDGWGGIVRQDWVEVPGRPGFWMISGESPGGEGDKRGYMYDAPSTSGFYKTLGEAQAALGHSTGQQSLNAFRASLAAQGVDSTGIDPRTVGQVGMARAYLRSGRPVPEYYSPWLEMAQRHETAGPAKPGGPPGQPYDPQPGRPPVTGHASTLGIPSSNGLRLDYASIAALLKRLGYQDPLNRYAAGNLT